VGLILDSIVVIAGARRGRLRHSALPNGFMPFFKIVFGYSRVPQMMKDPKYFFYYRYWVVL